MEPRDDKLPGLSGRIAIGLLSIVTAVVGFNLIMPADGNSGGGNYIIFLVGAAFVLTLLARGDMLPAASGLSAAAVVVWLANPGGDNDGLQLLIVPWLGIIVLLVMGAASGGRSAWRWLTSQRRQ